jgi:Flp pilus assembly protein CpaB
MKPFLHSFFAGLALASAGVAAFTFVAVSRRVDTDRKEWELRPIVVAAQDVRMGETISFDVLSQRSIPARFITDSMVPPADVMLVINRPINMPLQAGDALLWPVFVDTSAPDACFKAIVAKVNAAGEAARHGALARFEERIEGPLPKPEPVPELKADASGEVSIVVLTAEVPAGEVIDESMLAAGKFPSNLVTASFVPAERLRDVVGTRTVVPLQPKDALMWQMLDNARQPRRTISCALEAATALDEARARAIREETAAYVRSLEAP